MANIPASADQSRTTNQWRHSEFIDAIVEDNPGAQRKGFWAAIRALAEEVDAEIEKYRFLPDAFRINRETETIEIHEAVVTHHPPIHKLHEMGLFWMSWDSEGPHDWLPVLFVHREGAAPQQYDLCYWYHDWLRVEAGRPVTEIDRLNAQVPA